MIKATPENTH